MSIPHPHTYIICLHLFTAADVNYPNAVQRDVGSNGYVKDLTDACVSNLNLFTPNAGGGRMQLHEQTSVPLSIPLCKAFCRLVCKAFSQAE